MGKLEDPGLFLGCTHERFERKLADGTTLVGVEYNMKKFLETTCHKYMEKAGGVFGRPISSFPAALSPACTHTFPVWEWGKPRPGLCASTEKPENYNGRLPLGSPIFLNEKQLPLQQSKDVEERAKFINAAFALDKEAIDRQAVFECQELGADASASIASRAIAWPTASKAMDVEAMDGPGVKRT